MCLSRRTASLVVALLIAASLPAIRPANVRAANLGSILPLGDSLTDGTVAGGYRDPLYTDLTSAGYSFTFVGTQADNATATLTAAGDAHHEGHSGYTISAISGRSGIDDNLASYIGPGGANPNYILLMIGTNDVDTGNASTAAARLDALITHISDKTSGYRPNAHLIVASIIRINDPTEEAQVQSYNSGILSDVFEHQALGENVTFLDMHGSLLTTDLADKLHPNQGGYNKMAQGWFDAIQSVPEPASIGFVALGAVVILRRTR